MATKRYPAPTTGIVMSPKGVAPGVGVLYVNGVPTQFVALRTPLAPGYGVEYQNGKAVRFVPPASSGGAGAAPAPAAPAQRSFQPEDDPAYNLAQQAAQASRDISQAGLMQARTAGLKDYGFNEAYDPTKPFGALTFDPTNPFSKAALLKSSYDTSRRAAGQSMASQGQLYAGSYQNRQDLINRGQLQSEDTLQKSLQNFLARNTQQFGQTGVDYLKAIGGAAGDAAYRFAANPPS